ncbi:hypothetical protein TcWFU_006999 [Taenia crassiceps]|uniref:ANK_REP_REGION domain-containing protein n=1 Tax=Taenia crassiceps TaxID=6207 RepID=A0ABR4PZP8_9CEST
MTAKHATLPNPLLPPANEHSPPAVPPTRFCQHDPNTHRDDPTTTPLIEATKRGHVETMQLLMRNGTHPLPHANDNGGGGGGGNTALQCAARHANLAAVSLLCKWNGML